MVLEGSLEQKTDEKEKSGKIQSSVNNTGPVREVLFLTTLLGGCQPTCQVR